MFLFPILIVMKKIKDILIRYSLLIFIVLIISTPYFHQILSIIFSNIISQVLPNAIVNNQSIIINNTLFNIVDSCIAPFAYVLIAFIFLTTPQHPKKSIILIIITSILFSIFNLIRIISLIIIYNKYGYQTFNNLHFIFYEFVTGLLLGIIILTIFKLYKLNLKTVFIEDIKYIIQNFK